MRRALQSQLSTGACNRKRGNALIVAARRDAWLKPELTSRAGGVAFASMPADAFVPKHQVAPPPVLKWTGRRHRELDQPALLPRARSGHWTPRSQGMEQRRRRGSTAPLLSRIGLFDWAVCSRTSEVRSGSARGAKSLSSLNMPLGPRPALLPRIAMPAFGRRGGGTPPVYGTYKEKWSPSTPSNASLTLIRPVGP